MQNYFGETLDFEHLIKLAHRYETCPGTRKILMDALIDKKESVDLGYKVQELRGLTLDKAICYAIDRDWVLVLRLLILYTIHKGQKTKNVHSIRQYIETHPDKLMTMGLGNFLQILSFDCVEKMFDALIFDKIPPYELVLLIRPFFSTLVHYLRLKIIAFLNRHDLSIEDEQDCTNLKYLMSVAYSLVCDREDREGRTMVYRTLYCDLGYADIVRDALCSPVSDVVIDWCKKIYDKWGYTFCLMDISCLATKMVQNEKVFCVIFEKTAFMHGGIKNVIMTIFTSTNWYVQLNKVTKRKVFECFAHYFDDEEKKKLGRYL